MITSISSEARFNYDQNLWTEKEVNNVTKIHGCTVLKRIKSIIEQVFSDPEKESGKERYNKQKNR